jgi:hypothetical protein
MPTKLKSPRLIVRHLVRLRREGGSISMTVPVHIVRKWKLRPGAALVLRSTDEGILLYPSFFGPFLKRPRRSRVPIPQQPLMPRPRLQPPAW